MRNEGGGFAAIDDEVAAVLAFVISYTTFLAAQDDEMRRRVLECMVFTKDEKPVNLLNLQNPFNL